MKAKEALRVPGSITYKGWILTDSAMDEKTGRKRVAVATLLVHSVKTAIISESTVAMAQGGIDPNGVI